MRPPYPAYKESGVRWLGPVPNAWGVTRLMRAASVNDDVLPESTPPSFEMEYVDIGSVSLGRGIERTEQFSFADAPSRARRLVRDGDVLVSMVRTYLKAIAPVVNPPENLVVSTGFAVVRPTPKLDSAYAKYVLQSTGFVDEVISRSTGVSYPAINVSDLLRIFIPLPPRGEQTAIAAFLDRETGKIDALIAEQEKLIALLAEKRQATISHAVTRGLNPDAPLMNSGVDWLGKIPAHWSVVPIKYLVELKSGGTPSKDIPEYWNGDLPWASAKDLKVERLAATAEGISNFAIESGVASMARAGAVLIVVRGMILARTFPVVEALVPMAFNQDLKAVLPLERVSSQFLAWLLRGSADESLRRLDEAGHGTKALRMEAWTSMQLPVPPMSEQAAIADFLLCVTEQIDSLRAETERGISLLKERRSALISVAVTGQIDVRGVILQVGGREDVAA